MEEFNHIRYDAFLCKQQRHVNAEWAQRQNRRAVDIGSGTLLERCIKDALLRINQQFSLEEVAMAMRHIGDSATLTSLQAILDRKAIVLGTEKLDPASMLKELAAIKLDAELRWSGLSH